MKFIYDKLKSSSNENKTFTFKYNQKDSLVITHSKSILI